VGQKISVYLNSTAKFIDEFLVNNKYMRALCKSNNLMFKTEGSFYDLQKDIDDIKLKPRTVELVRLHKFVIFSKK